MGRSLQPTSKCCLPESSATHALRTTSRCSLIQVTAVLSSVFLAPGGDQAPNLCLFHLRHSLIESSLAVLHSDALLLNTKFQEDISDVQQRELFV